MPQCLPTLNQLNYEKQGQTPHFLPEGLVEGVLVLAVPVLQVNAKRVVPLACHLVDVLIAQPELTIEVPKTLLVLVPGPVEIN